MSNDFTVLISTVFVLGLALGWLYRMTRVGGEK